MIVSPLALANPRPVSADCNSPGQITLDILTLGITAIDSCPFSEDPGCPITDVAAAVVRGSQGVGNVYDYRLIGECGDIHVHAQFLTTNGDAVETLEGKANTIKTTWNCTGDPWIPTAPGNANYSCTLGQVSAKGTISDDELAKLSEATQPFSTMNLAPGSSDALWGQLQNSYAQLPPAKPDGSPCDPLTVTDLTGPTMLDVGATATYQAKVSNPNPANSCDMGMWFQFLTTGPVKLAGGISGPDGMKCLDEPDGARRCTLDAFGGGATATFSMPLVASSKNFTNVEVWVWNKKSDLPSREDDKAYKSLALNPITHLIVAAWKNLNQGDSGPVVTMFQHLLRNKGQGLDVDGDFGPKTTAAVKAFQQIAKITPADGTVSRPTWEALVIQVSRGSKGEAVSAVQDRLASLGVDIAVDGDFGDQTEQAVRAFQKAHDLPVDGVVGTRVWSALSSAN